jgi:hypothetical protein
MPRRKPAGWPDLMIEKRLSTGAIAYYWAPPTRAKLAGYIVTSEALGTDYGAAKKRCDDILNPHYKAWLNKGREEESPANLRIGSFDWLVSVFKASPKYSMLPAETRSSYDRVLRLVSQYQLNDKRTLGFLPLAAFTPGAADALFEKLKINSKGDERVRTAVLAMRVCSRAWTVARRAEPRRVPLDNPFGKMGLAYKAKPTRLFQHDDLMKFVAAADAAGHRSVGTAAMIAFFWLQRQKDILNRLTWSQYRPSDAPDVARIFHFKTQVPIDMPLLDEGGNDLWPELTARLDASDRHGTLMVTRDAPDRLKKVRLPWEKRHFARTVSKIRKAAGIDPAIKFMGLRPGGNTEGGDADLTDTQLRALSGHLTTSMTRLYTQQTIKQRQEAARKRRDSRTKRGRLSE